MFNDLNLTSHSFATDQNDPCATADDDQCDPQDELGVVCGGRSGNASGCGDIFPVGKFRTTTLAMGVTGISDLRLGCLFCVANLRSAGMVSRIQFSIGLTAIGTNRLGATGGGTTGMLRMIGIFRQNAPSNKIQ